MNKPIRSLADIASAPQIGAATLRRLAMDAIRANRNNAGAAARGLHARLMAEAQEAGIERLPPALAALVEHAVYGYVNMVADGFQVVRDGGRGRSESGTRDTDASPAADLSGDDGQGGHDTHPMGAVTPGGGDSSVPAALHSEAGVGLEAGETHLTRASPASEPVADGRGHAERDTQVTLVPLVREPSTDQRAAAAAVARSAAAVLLKSGEAVRELTIGYCISEGRRRTSDAYMLRVLGNRYGHLPHSMTIAEAGVNDADLRSLQAQAEAHANAE